MADSINDNYVIKFDEIDISGEYSYYVNVNSTITINGKEVCGGYYRTKGEKYIPGKNQKYVAVFVDFSDNKKYYIDDQNNVYDYSKFIVEKVGRITKPKELFNFMKYKNFHCGIFPVISEELLGFYVFGKRHNDNILGTNKDYFFDIKNSRRYFVKEDGQFVDSACDRMVMFDNDQLIKQMKNNSNKIVDNFRKKLSTQKAKLEAEKSKVLMQEDQKYMETDNMPQNISVNNNTRPFDDITQPTNYARQGNNVMQSTNVEQPSNNGIDFRNTTFYDQSGFETSSIDSSGTRRDVSGRNHMGRILPNGRIEDQQGNPDGRVLPNGTIEDQQGNPNGRILPNGTIEDQQGNPIGSIRSNNNNCFLTTACITSKGLPDDCYELQMLRVFRDSYIKSLKNGKVIIKEYYKIAPQIIENIDRLPNRVEIYNEMYEKLVLGSIKHIEQGKNKEAFKNYIAITLKLKKKYYRAKKKNLAKKIVDKLKIIKQEMEFGI